MSGEAPHGRSAELIYVGFGGNEGGEGAIRQRFRAAARSLAALPYVQSVAQSSLYLTAPQGPFRDQAPFVNALVAIEAPQAPEPSAVLATLLAIEADLGRDRAEEQPLGPRPIDLDLLLYGPRAERSPGPPATEVPHPRLGERAFALAPLAEVAGRDLWLPGVEATVGQRLADVMVRAQPVSWLSADW